jgi:hypothetical protein
MMRTFRTQTPVQTPVKLLAVAMDSFDPVSKNATTQTQRAEMVVTPFAKKKIRARTIFVQQGLRSSMDAILV